MNRKEKKMRTYHHCTTILPTQNETISRRKKKPMCICHNVTTTPQWWSILLTQIRPWTRGGKIMGTYHHMIVRPQHMIVSINAYTKWKHEHEGKKLWALATIAPWSWLMMPSHQCLHKTKPWTWTWSRKVLGTCQCVIPTPWWWSNVAKCVHKMKIKTCHKHDKK
jgi:hypothetical protein